MLAISDRNKPANYIQSLDSSLEVTKRKERKQAHGESNMLAISDRNKPANYIHSAEKKPHGFPGAALERSMGGVFLSTRNIFCSHDSFDTLSTDESTPPTSWMSSSTVVRNVPLFAQNPEKCEEEEIDDAVALGRIVARSRKLPKTWYFASNHVMINQERARRTCAPLIRMKELDTIARDHAEKMAERGELFHSQPTDVADKFQRKSTRFGENIGSGQNIRDIHKEMMKTRSERNNILDRRYTHMGMATAKSSDGTLYLCQLFRG